MGKLILIKHSMPNITSEIPSNQWTLSEEGINRIRLFASKLERYNFTKLYSSNEPKAIETAQILGQELSKKIEVIEGIHEHERGTKRVIYPKEQWIKLMNEFFNSPDELVFGEETATAAMERFKNPIHHLVKNSPSDKDILVVTHGTVISLFISIYNKVDIFNIWDSLGLPSFVELDAEEFRLNKIVNIG